MKTQHIQHTTIFSHPLSLSVSPNLSSGSPCAGSGYAPRRLPTPLESCFMCQLWRCLLLWVKHSLKNARRAGHQQPQSLCLSLCLCLCLPILLRAPLGTCPPGQETGRVGEGEVMGGGGKEALEDGWGQEGERGVGGDGK